MADGEQDQQQADVIIIGAGAAGLMTALWVGRTAPGARILLLEGARTLGAKILVAGGGRCNVTHDAVSESDYAGSTGPAIRKVLRRFGVTETVRLFRELGVDLKREETGKLFPTTDDARTVLNALLHEVRSLGVVLTHPARVENVGRDESGFVVSGNWGAAHAPRLVLATGGKALPKSGSDGAGYRFARAFGHSVTEAVFPALVPLLLPEGHPLRDLAGITFDAEFRLAGIGLRSDVRFRDSTLCTHFGLSGPSVLNMSRFLTEARLHVPTAHLLMNCLPGMTADAFDRELASGVSATPLSALRGRLPERLARALCGIASIDPGANLRQTAKASRQRFARSATELRVEPIGDRGFTHAEATAGGVPLSELHLDTMESRRQAGLWVVGELCDVDGRIGGFNFQWAWSSGFMAGVACGVSIVAARRGQ